MKAINDNGTIRVYATLPNEWKHFLNFAQADEALQKAEGFYDLVEPSYDPDVHRLGELYFDQENEVFTYKLIEIPLDEVKQKLYDDFSSAKHRTRNELIEALFDKLIEINRDKLPIQLVALYDALIAENARVYRVIEDLYLNDQTALRKFRIIPEDVERFVSEINKFKL